MSYTLTQAKDLVINQGYAICNDDTVDKLREVLEFIFPLQLTIANGHYSYYFKDSHFFNDWDCFKICNGKSINLSEIEIPKQITIEMVIELTKKHTNDMDLGSELRKLLNN